MHGDDFKAISGDLPFILDDERRDHHSQFWVNAEVLNVRSGPSLKHRIISETYYGNHVFAFAKKGQWVAISPELILQQHGVDIRPRWVNMEYLSALQIKKQVNTSVLKNKCSFESYEKYLRKIRGGMSSMSSQELVALQNIYEPCSAVKGYISQQQLKSRPHDYIHEYETWRQSHSEPDKYSSPSCYRLN